MREPNNENASRVSLEGAIRDYNAPRVRFTATVGEEPEVEVALV